MNEALQTLEVKVENNGTTPQGKIFAREWNVLVEAVKALDLKEFDEAKLLQFLRDNDFITSEDIPDVDFSNVVTLSGQQTIPGAKDFVGGIKVNGMPIIYNAELGVWEFTGDLFVTGNFAWGSSIDGFKPSTVMDAVRVDGSTIIKKKDSNGDWYLYAPGGGSGGSGGGLTLGDVVSYLSDNDYTTKVDVNSLIASSLVGYATQSWVGDNYLSSSGGTISGDLSLNQYLRIKAWAGNGSGSCDMWYNGNNGILSITAQNITNYFGDAFIHSGNIGQQSVNRAASAGTTDSVSVIPVTESGNYSLALLTSSSTRTQAVCVGNNHKALFNPSTGALTATSFVGNLTGNADSAHKQVIEYSSKDIDVWDIPNGTARILGIVESSNLPPDTTSTGSILTEYAWDSNAGVQIYFNNVNNKILYRSRWGGTFYDWRTIAHTGSNVASATKLQTPRFIWGHSFDGQSDISGKLCNVTDIAFSSQGSITNKAGWRVLDIMEDYINIGYGYGVRGYDTFIGGNNLHLRYGTSQNTGILLNYSGNIAIGGTTADAKLHVHGTTILGGDTTINGNLLVNGNVSWFSHSQRSLKNIVSEQGLSLAQLERIKPIKFYWKDGRDMVLHVGGVADVFAEVLPEVVARNLQDILCLNYVDAAFYVGASLIAPVLDHERRITKGEEEQEALKKENAKLKRELEEVKSKLNHLAA